VLALNNMRTSIARTVMIIVLAVQPCVAADVVWVMLRRIGSDLCVLRCLVVARIFIAVRAPSLDKVPSRNRRSRGAQLNLLAVTR